MKSSILFVGLVIGLIGGAWARGQEERITSFDSRIVVGSDGGMTVTETIAVEGRQEKIRHGIYRDFPTTYKDARGVTRKVPFQMVKADRDGQPEQYRIEGQINGVRVYLGSKGVTLENGSYRYTLVYRTSRQLGFFLDHDELYWNVTGNGWDFPIDKASAAVELPGVDRGQLKMEAYTGAQGAKGTAYRAEAGGDGLAKFWTTRGLGMHEGLTIVVSFPKGVIAAPTQEQEFWYFVSDNRGAMAGVGGLLAVLMYCVIAWVRVGRDPAKGTIVPLFEPPSGFSPAAVRFLMRMGYDEKCFTATVVNMAVKGLARIDEGKKHFTIERGSALRGVLAAEELKAANALFDGRMTVVLEQANHASIRKAIDELKKSLAWDMEKKYFFSNQKYLIPAVGGAVLTMVGMELLGAGAAQLPPVLFLTVWLSFWSIGVYALGSQLFRNWRAALGGAPGAVGNWAGAIGMSLFALPFFAGEVFALGAIVWMTTVWTGVVLLMLVGVIVLFHHLLKAPTSNGRKVMDQIDGFKMYLGTAEGQRMRELRPPEKTVELFEKYLPYAIALDMENCWAEQFAEELAAAKEGDRAYSPGWYNGTSWAAVGAGGFAAGLGSGLGSAISSASTAPGSSSGSSGGGSSGGGGGGGGGGGW